MKKSVGTGGREDFQEWTIHLYISGRKMLSNSFVYLFPRSFESITRGRQRNQLGRFIFNSSTMMLGNEWRIRLFGHGRGDIWSSFTPTSSHGSQRSRHSGRGRFLFGDSIRRDVSCLETTESWTRYQQPRRKHHVGKKRSRTLRWSPHNDRQVYRIKI